MTATGGPKTVITSWDDTSISDLKLADLLDKYAVRGTFFAVTGQIGRSILKEDLVALSNRHEVGSHTATHPSLPAIDEASVHREIYESKDTLDSILGRKTHSFCYPYGNYNREISGAVEAAGYRCARGFDPYHFETPEDEFRVDVGVWAEPHGFFYSRGRKNTANLLRLVGKNRGPLEMIGTAFQIRNWSRLSKKLFDIFLENGSVFHLVGHAWRIDSSREWEKLEEVLAYISGRKNIAYLTLGEFVERMKKES